MLQDENIPASLPVCCGAPQLTKAGSCPVHTCSFTPSKSPKYPTNLCQIFQHTPQTFCRLQTYAPLYSCFINIIFPLPPLLALPVSCRVGEESWLVTLPLPWRETTSPVTQLPAASCLLPLPPCKLEATKLAPCSVCYHHAPVLFLMQNSTFLLSCVHIIEAYCRCHYFI